MWLNISQEGKDDIDDIREGGLINGLKLSSEDLQPITAYQVRVCLRSLPPLVRISQRLALKVGPACSHCQSTGTHLTLLD